MVRRIALTSITGLCLTLACSDGDEGDGGDATGGVFGSQVDTGGRGGTGGGGGTGGLDANGGKTSANGGQNAAGNPGANGGTGGDTTSSGGKGGNATGSGGDGGDSTSTGEGGMDPIGSAGMMNAAGETEPGSGGAGGDAGTGTGDGGMAGDDGGEGGAPSEPEGGEGGAAGAPVEPEPEPEPKGLVVHYAFDEGSGTTSEDKAGYFDPATLSDATWAPGRAGTTGVELSAAEAHVVLPNGIFEGASKGTVAVWVKQAAFQPWSRVFDFNSAKGFLYFAPDLDASGGRFSIFTGNEETESILRTAAPLPLDVWKHVAITIDGTTHTMFVDGYPVHTLETPRHLAEIEPTEHGWLGKSTFDVDPNFKGVLDDFQVYDIVLTRSEIADLAWPDEDYSYLRMDETSGTTATDSSDRAFDGTLVDGATFTENGHLGGAVDLAGGYVSVDPLIATSCDDLTIALWAKIETPQSWARLFDVFGRWEEEGGDPPGNWIFFTPTADVGEGVQELRFAIFKGYDSQVSAPYPAETDLTEWHHYAVTLSGTTARLYFDGAQIGINEGMTLKPSDLELGPDAAAWLGKSTFPDPNLDGILDEVRIACRAFTEGEIRQLATP